MLEYPESFHLFWRGPFSQWHPSVFFDGSTKYVHAEQFMMASKAAFFKDEDTYFKILEAVDPMVSKKLGKTVSGFDERVWIENRYSIVLKGSYLKFSQNEELKSILMSTGTKTLVEASPYDKIWGIGLGEENPRAHDRAQWQGLNLLGQALTSVREIFKADIFRGNVSVTPT